MWMEPNPTEVRRLVLRKFEQLGRIFLAAEELCETVRFSTFGSPGRRYHAADMLAEWIRDEGILRFFDAGGNLVDSINLWTSTTPTTTLHQAAA